MYNIIQELNANNGSNHKLAVLKSHKDNVLLQRVLKMAYDRVDYTYGISLKNVPAVSAVSSENITLEQALDVLGEQLATRKVTGNAAIELLTETFSSLSEEDEAVVRGVINRDLRINLGRSNINKVFKNLIVKPVYMRCGLYSEKTAAKIDPNGAYVQLKADGTYREFTVENESITCNSRSGEVYEYPHLEDTLVDYPSGHYIGELTVVQDGKVLDRSTGNGLINSYHDKIGKCETAEEKRALEVAENARIVLDLWDYITLEEYTNAANKIQGTTPYHTRFNVLNNILEDVHGCDRSGNVQLIETHVVKSIPEALCHCARWMNEGLEGAILKDANAIFRDGTSPQQLKMKLEIDVDVRITGFKAGSVGTKRDGKIGSIEFATDDGKIKGFASGFSDAELDDMDAKRDLLIGSIMSLTCNDITKGRNNEHYALSHPRFNEIRTDKEETDTLERIFEAKRMAMELED